MYVNNDTGNFDVKEYKKKKRAEYLAVRRNIPPEERRLLDEDIRRRLISLKEYQDCGTVLTYVSYGTEADTKEIIKDALSRGKTVAVPRCIRGTNEMNFYMIESLDQLSVGEYSILEPSVLLCPLLKEFEGAVCIVPALVYDSEGFRIGYGKGYYDRFLSVHGGFMYKIGIEYSSCTESMLVTGGNDIPVDILITENNVKKIR